MRDKHEPHDDFIDRLESQIVSEVRRRQRQIDPPRWPMRSRLKLAVAAVGLALVSMGVGGAVVAAAYQAQDKERRDMVAALYELQLGLAKQAHTVAMQALRSTQSKAAVGVATKIEALEAQGKVQEAEAHIRSVELQLEEVRLTGREPIDKVSAPLVSGKDFVTERWRNDLIVPKSALSIAQAQLSAAMTRFGVGLADALETAMAESRVRELEAAIVGIERKMEIRQRFSRGLISAVQADLMVLETEADLRLRALKPRLELARRQLEQTAQRVKSGAAQEIELAEAKYRQQQVETEISKAELDLALVHRRLAEIK